jgi:hypothetical protein
MAEIGEDKVFQADLMNFPFRTNVAALHPDEKRGQTLGMA